MSALILPAIGIFLIYLLIKALSAPIKLVLKLLIHAAFGYVALFAVNFFGSAYGISVSMDFVSSLIAGFLGVPGVIILVAVRFFGVL